MRKEPGSMERRITIFVSEEFAAELKSEVARWGKVIADAKIPKIE